MYLEFREIIKIAVLNFSMKCLTFLRYKRHNQGVFYCDRIGKKWSLQRREGEKIPFQNPKFDIIVVEAHESYSQKTFHSHEDIITDELMMMMMMMMHSSIIMATSLSSKAP
jgi:hypothetical protein